MKKSTVEEGTWKSPEELKNEPLEQLKSTESLKKERPKHKPEKKKPVYIYIYKTALQIAKNNSPANSWEQTRQTQSEKAKQWMDPNSANWWEQNQKGKSCPAKKKEDRTQKRERSPTKP